MQGCDSNFLDEISLHLLFIKQFFLNRGITLNNSFEQLTEIEAFIADNQQEAELHTRDFFQGLVAYCGELLRAELSGQWEMVTSSATTTYPENRYFPAIVDENGQEYEFSAVVEHQLAYLLNPALNWDKMDGLYYAMRFQLARKLNWLPVKKIDSWFFPPLNEAVE